MIRLNLAAVFLAVIVVLSTPARAVTLEPASPIGRLFGMIVYVQTCQIPVTEAQMKSIGDAGQALQDKLGASEDDMAQLATKFGDGMPPGGCDKYKADFNSTLAKNLATVP